MSTDFFSSVSSKGLQTVMDNKLFRGILDAMPTGVQLLKAVRNNKQEIIDFIYELANDAAENYVGKEVAGKKFLSHPSPLNTPHVFEKLVAVVNTDNTENLVHHYNYDGFNKWLHYTINKFSDGVMIMHEDITEQEEAKNEIEKKEENYRSLIENTPDVVTRWNKNLQLVYANSAFEEKTGMPLSQLLGKTNKQMGEPDHIAYPYMEKLRLAFATGEQQEHYNSYPTPHGETYFYSRIVPEKNAEGEVETVLGIARDITDIQTAQGEIEQQASYIERIAETIPDMISVTNLETRTFEYLNKETFKDQGFDPAIMNLRSPEELNEIIYSEDRHVLADYFQKFLTASDEEIISAEYRAKDDNGQWKWFFVRGTVFQRNNTGAARHILNVIENITERKKARQALQEKIELLKRAHAILNAVNEACYELDKNGNVIFVNRQALEWWNLQAEKVVGRNIWDIFPESVSTHCYDAIQISALNNKKFSQYEYVSAVFNRWIALSAIPTETGCIVIFGDIDERKRAEQEIFRLKDEVAQKATDKYLTLFNNMEQGFCIIEVIFNETGKATDYRFLEINPVFEKQTGLRNAVGKTMRELQPNHEQHWFEIYGNVARTRKPVQFENVTFLAPSGLQSGVWYDVFAFPFGAEDQNQVAILFNNVTQRREAEEALRVSEERQKFLLKFSDALRTLIDPIEIQSVAARLLGEYLNVNLVHYAETDGDYVVIQQAWANGIQPIIGRMLHEAYGKRLIEGLRAGKTQVCYDANADPTISKEECELLSASKILAYIAVPLIKKGEWVATFAAHANQPVTWKDDKIELVEEIAERTWAAVERARAEKALKESEQRLQRMVNVPRVGVLTFDYNDIMISANDAFLEMVGYTREEFEAQQFTWRDFTPLEYVQASMQVVEQLQKTGLGGPYEKPYFHKDGSRVWMMFVAADLGDGRIAEYAIDITSTKKAEQALEESKVRLALELEETKQLQRISGLLIKADNIQLLYEQIVDAIVAIMHSDAASLQVYLPETNELLLLAWRGFHPESAAFWRLIKRDSTTTCGQAFSTRERVMIEDTTKWPLVQGTEDLVHYKLSEIKSLQSTPLISRSGELIGMISTHWKQPYSPSEREWQLLDVLARQATDLLERNQREEKYLGRLQKDVEERTNEIIKQHAILRQSEDIAETGSWEYDVNTKEFLWSDGMYQLFEMKKGIPVSPSVYLDYALEEDKALARKIVENIQKSFVPFEEILRLKLDGKIKTVKIKASFLKNENNKIDKMLGVDLDITRAREAEAKIHELNKILIAKNRELESANSELKTLNAVAANDYRENLRNMYTNLEFIITKDSKYLSDTGKANLRRAQTAIQKMKLLTEDIVAFSRIKALEQDIADVDLNELLKTVLDDINDKILESRAKIERNELPVIKGYHSLLFLLFHHLLDNAIKFRDSDKKLAISIQYSSVEGFVVNSGNARNEWYYRISVIDNGIGFEQKNAEKIFGMFYRLPQKNKYKGSGIGLAVCKKIIDLHDGFIMAEGDVGKGSAFHCFFPMDK